MSESTDYRWSSTTPVNWERFPFLRWKAKQTAEHQHQQAYTTGSDSRFLTLSRHKKIKVYPQKTSKRNQTLIFRLKVAFTQGKSRILLETYMLEDFDIITYLVCWNYVEREAPTGVGLLVRLRAVCEEVQLVGRTHTQDAPERILP